MEEFLFMTIGAFPDCRNNGFIVSTTLAGTGLRMSTLRIGHGIVLGTKLILKMFFQFFPSGVGLLSLAGAGSMIPILAASWTETATLIAA